MPAETPAQQRFWEKERARVWDKIEKEEATPQDKFEFHLIEQSREIGPSTEQLIMALIVLKIARIPGGLGVIRDLGKEFLRGIFSTMHALGQASAANKVTAWANPYMVSMILHKFGFVTNFDLVQFRVGLSVIAGAGVVEGFIDQLSSVLPFTKPEPSEYPSSIVFSSPVTTEEIQELGEALEETEK